jgi:hypothetical protein
MSDPNQPTVPAGWYPDGQGGQRWWDGTQWTEHTQPPAAGPAADATVVAPRPQQQPPAQPQFQQPQFQQPQFQQSPAQPYVQQPYGQQPQQPGQQFAQQFAQPGWTPPPSGGGGRKLGLVLGGVAAAVVVLVLLVVVLVKVVGGGGPEGVATDYLEARFDGDYETACELTAEDQRESLLDGADADDCAALADKQEKDDEEASKNLEDEYDLSVDEIRASYDVEYEVKDVDEDDDKATVEVRQTAEFTGDDKFVDEVLDGDRTDARTLTVKLVKEDGDWKVEDADSD